MSQRFTPSQQSGHCDLLISALSYIFFQEMNMPFAIGDLTKELRARYRTGSSWKVLFDLFSGYNRRFGALPVETAANRTGLASTVIVEKFKELSELGIGDFKYGRHGRRTRLIWRFSPSSVGLVASGSADELESYDEHTSEDDEENSSTIGADMYSPASQAEIVWAARNELADKLGIDPEQIKITITY